MPIDRPVSDQPRPDPIGSPCVGLCSTGFDDVCRGCLRTVDEVARWIGMPPAEKRAVWVRILSQGYKPRRPADARP